MNAEGRSLFRAVLADLGDPAPKLVFADWLEEHGHDARYALAYRWAAARNANPRYEFGKKSRVEYGWSPDGIRLDVWYAAVQAPRRFQRHGSAHAAFLRLAKALDSLGITSVQEDKR